MNDAATNNLNVDAKNAHQGTKTQYKLTIDFNSTDMSLLLSFISVGNKNRRELQYLGELYIYTISC